MAPAVRKPGLSKPRSRIWSPIIRLKALTCCWRPVEQDDALDRWREDTWNYALLGGLLSLVVIGAMVMLHRALERQRQAIRLLSVREAQLHSIFSNAGAGIVLLGRDGSSMLPTMPLPGSSDVGRQT